MPTSEIELHLAFVATLIASFAIATVAIEPVLTSAAVASNLQSPWDIAVLPGGSAILYTEKCHGLSIMKKSISSASFGPPLRLFGVVGSVLEAPDLFCQGQSGMHGVTIDPDFGRTNR